MTRRDGHQDRCDRADRFRFLWRQLLELHPNGMKLSCIALKANLDLSRVDHFLADREAPSQTAISKIEEALGSRRTEISALLVPRFCCVDRAVAVNRSVLGEISIAAYHARRSNARAFARYTPCYCLLADLPPGVHGATVDLKSGGFTIVVAQQDKEEVQLLAIQHEHAHIKRAIEDHLYRNNNDNVRVCHKH